MFGIIREESPAKYLAPCSCITDLGGEENDTGHRSRPFMPREPCRCFARKSWGGGGVVIQTGTRGKQQERESSVTTSSHTHTASPLLGNPVGKHYSVAALHGDSAEGHTKSWTCSCSEGKSKHQAPDTLMGRKPVGRDQLLLSLPLHIACF